MNGIDVVGLLNAGYAPAPAAPAEGMAPRMAVDMARVAEKAPVDFTDFNIYAPGPMYQDAISQSLLSGYDLSYAPENFSTGVPGLLGNVPVDFDETSYSLLNLALGDLFGGGGGGMGFDLGFGGGGFGLGFGGGGGGFGLGGGGGGGGFGGF